LRRFIFRTEFEILDLDPPINAIPTMVRAILGIISLQEAVNHIASLCDYEKTKIEQLLKYMNKRTHQFI